MAKLIRMSEAASLALHSMAMVAGNGSVPLATGEAAARLGVSQAHLSKVFQRLARGGLVKAVRGPGGGFVLGRHGGAVTLLEVYEAIEGKCEPSECLFGAIPCGARRCIMKGAIVKADAQLRNYLAKTRLSDLEGAFPQ